MVPAQSGRESIYGEDGMTLAGSPAVSCRFARAVRTRSVIRAAAGTALALGVAAPLVRRRVKLPPSMILGTAAMAPVALCVLFPRSRARDVGTVTLQMWAYLAGYEIPNDDPEALKRRVRIGYPVKIDRALGFGTPPTVRLQRAFSEPGHFNAFEKTMVWSHWVWFMVPHGAVAYLLLRHPERFERGAVKMYATFDLGLVAYHRLPTAPPWYAAQRGYMEDGKTPELRRMMVEYGEEFWKSGWAPLFDFLAGNPLAAMPSLHFATSVTAARLLGELAPAHPVPGALAWGYALTLGLALVYLGEHYVVDLAAGYALTEVVRRAAPRLDPVAGALSRAVQALEARAA
jgi:membrane-associated phospholipid phosphatase